MNFFVFLFKKHIYLLFKFTFTLPSLSFMHNNSFPCILIHPSCFIRSNFYWSITNEAPFISTLKCTSSYICLMSCSNKVSSHQNKCEKLYDYSILSHTNCCRMPQLIISTSLVNAHIGAGWSNSSSSAWETSRALEQRVKHLL